MASLHRCPKCQQFYPLSQTHCAVDRSTLVQAEQVPALAPHTLVGQLLDNRYRLDGVLGSGGMGTVYLAQHTITHETYAVKVMHSQLMTDEAALMRFDREARALGGIDHPHVVEVYDHGRTPSGVPYLVMEYLRGTTLRQCLQDMPGGGLQLLQAVSIAKQVATALQQVHERGIVHRDIKPDNIQLTVNNERSVFVKLFDFGIARIQNQGGVTELNKGGPPTTLAYAAPEIHLKSHDVGPAIDVYALGITLFEMVTKERPFSGTGLDVVWAHMKDAPRQLGQCRRDVKIPAALEQLTAQMLEKQPTRRPSLTQVMDGLAALTTSLQAEAARNLHSLRTYVLPDRLRPAPAGSPKVVPALGQLPLPSAVNVLSSVRDIDQIETERERVSGQLQKGCAIIIMRHMADGASAGLVERLRRCVDIEKEKSELTAKLTLLEDELAQQKAASRAKRNTLRQQLQERRDALRALPANAGPSWNEMAQDLARLERAYAATEPASETAEQVQQGGTRQQQLQAELLDAQRSMAEDLVRAIMEPATPAKNAGSGRVDQRLDVMVRRLLELMGQLDALNASLRQA